MGTRANRTAGTLPKVVTVVKIRRMLKKKKKKKQRPWKFIGTVNVCKSYSHNSILQLSDALLIKQNYKGNVTRSNGRSSIIADFTFELEQFFQ